MEQCPAYETTKVTQPPPLPPRTYLPSSFVIFKIMCEYKDIYLIYTIKTTFLNCVFIVKSVNQRRVSSCSVPTNI